MSFEHSKYLVFALIFIAVFAFIVLRMEKKFFIWVQDHWFFKRTIINRFSTILYLLAIALMCFSLLDLRGPEEKLDSKIPAQRTIIILDTSSSMLVEDVRPNRFQKALLMARHFIKNSAGHQISIILFSDLTKRFLPFTSDIDLLDTRLDGLEKLDLQRGGSNLTMAIQEAIQYFKVPGKENKKLRGNLLIFSDSEETSDTFEIQIPESITVAFVGVGTRKGGRIPIRDPRIGYFKGYKRFQGKDVVSKLDEEFLKKLSKKIDNFKYWIALSYTLPTEEILKFFEKSHKEKFSEGQVSIRPVLSQYLLIPALILLVLSYCLKYMNVFKLTAFLVIFNLFPPIGFTQEKEKKMKELPEEEKLIKEEIWHKMKSGQSSNSENLKLGELLLKEGDYPAAKTIYEENNSEESISSKVNQATSDLAIGDIAKGLKGYQEVLDQISGKEGFEDLKNTIRQNSLLALNKMAEQQQQEKKQDKSKKGDENSENQKSGEGDSKDQKGDSKGDQKDQNKDENGQDKAKDKKDKGKDQEDQELSNPNKNNQPKMSDQKLKEKLPAILKQLMNDDKKIQEKMLDTKTHSRPRGGQKKDW